MTAPCARDATTPHRSRENGDASHVPISRKLIPAVEEGPAAEPQKSRQSPEHNGQTPLLGISGRAPEKTRHDHPVERTELEQQLTCVECGALSDERAEGWHAHLAGGVVDGYDIGQLEVAVYCPACAAAEFSDE